MNVFAFCRSVAFGAIRSSGPFKVKGVAAPPVALIRRNAFWLLIVGLTFASVQRSDSMGPPGATTDAPPLPPEASVRFQPNSYVYAAVFSPDGKALVSVDGDETIRLWEAATGKNSSILKGHTKGVRCVAFSPDGKILASGSFDKTVRLWEVASGKEIRALPGHQEYVRCVAFSPDGRTLVSVSNDGTIRLWEAATGKDIRSLTVSKNDTVESVAFSPDGKILASVGGETTRLWDVGTGKEVRKWTKAALRHDSPPAVHSVAFSPDGKALASGIGNFIRLWDVATGKEIITLEGHEGMVVINSLAFSPDGKTLASGSSASSSMDEGEEKCIRLWNLATGKAIQSLGGHPVGVYSVAFSPDGKTLASGGDKGVLVWKMPVAKK